MRLSSDAIEALHTEWLCAEGTARGNAMRSRLLLASRGLILAKAMAHASGERSPQELLSVGMLAVAEGLPSYDVSRGSYCGWATFTADCAIKAFARDALVRVPRSTERLWSKQGRTDVARPAMVPVDEALASPDAGLTAEGRMVEDEGRAAMQRALARLPPLELQVVGLLFGMDGQESLKPTAIATLLGVTVASVKATRDRALERMRRRLTRDV